MVAPAGKKAATGANLSRETETSSRHILHTLSADNENPASHLRNTTKA